MDTNKLNFSLDFHNSVIRLMLKDEVFGLKCMEHLGPDLFKGNFLPWAFARIKSHYEKFNKLPTAQILVDQFKTVNESSLAEFKKEFAAMAKADITEDKYIKDEMTKFIKYRQFLKMYDGVDKLFKESKFDDSYTFVSSGIEKINSISFEKDDIITSDNVWEVLNRSQEEEMKIRVPSGNSLLDRELKGGFEKRTVTTIMAGYNVGKSLAAINIAANAAKLGKKVLFIFHEGHKDNIVKQFIACLTGLRIRTIEYGGYVNNPQNLQKVKDAVALFDSHIRLKEFADFDKMYVEDVADYAKIVSKEMGSIDLLVDDYAGILTSRSLKYKELRMNMARVWQMFGILSKKLDVAVITIAQLNRVAIHQNREGSQIVRSSNVGEAIGISQHSDYILTLNRSLEDENDNKFIICLDKTREGRAGKLIECRPDFEAATLWSDSLGVKDAGYDLGVPKKKFSKKAEDDESETDESYEARTRGHV